MADKDFDKIFRDKLVQHETPVEDGMWGSIESALNTGAGVKGGSRYAFFKHRKFFGYAAAVAALLIIAAFLFEPESQPYIHQEDTDLVAISDENPSEPKNNLLKKQPIEKQPAVWGRNEKKQSYEVNDVIALTLDNIVPEDPAQMAADSIAVADSVVSVVPKVAEDGDFTFIGNGKYESGGYMEDLGLSKKKYSLSLFSNIVSNNISVSSQYLGTMAASGISHSDNGLRSMEIISEAKHSLPLNLGIQAQVRVNSYISIGAGISYTWLRSKYDGLINKKYHKIKQSLHYIGVPVNLYFTLMEKERLQLYANVGGAIERGIRASYRITSYDGTSYSANAKIDGFQYSANAGFGLEYRFLQPVGLYIEPNVVYYFDSHVPASIRTDQPLQVKAELGFRFHFK